MDGLLAYVLYEWRVLGRTGVGLSVGCLSGLYCLPGIFSLLTAPVAGRWVYVADYCSLIGGGF